VLTSHHKTSLVVSSSRSAVMRDGTDSSSPAHGADDKGLSGCEAGVGNSRGDEGMEMDDNVRAGAPVASLSLVTHVAMLQRLPKTNVLRLQKTTNHGGRQM
jgi:hypothetical protein